MRLRFEQEDLPILAAANYLARSMSISSRTSQESVERRSSRTTPRVPQTPAPGLGLDSIDILELALVVSKRYGVQLRANNTDNVKIFASLKSLCDYIAAHRSA